MYQDVCRNLCLGQTQLLRPLEVPNVASDKRRVKQYTFSLKIPAGKSYLLYYTDLSCSQRRNFCESGRIFFIWAMANGNLGLYDSWIKERKTNTSMGNDEWKVWPEFSEKKILHVIRTQKRYIGTCVSSSGHHQSEEILLL